MFVESTWMAIEFPQNLISTVNISLSIANDSVVVKDQYYFTSTPTRINNIRVYFGLGGAIQGWYVTWPTAKLDRIDTVQPQPTVAAALSIGIEFKIYIPVQDGVLHS